MSMKQHVAHYVAHKRSLGCEYQREERLLLSWADAATARGEDAVCADTMIRWAYQTSSNDEARRRLAVGHQFAVWLQAEDERNEVPHMECLGRSRKRPRVPFLLSDDQIRTLMKAALRLPPAGSITPHTLHCIIGLIAVTGLRRAEACALQMSDITEDGLVVRQTKFFKSRLLPISDSTRDALDRYVGLRKTLGGASDHLFVLSTGKPMSPDVLSGKFIKLVRSAGLRGGKGKPGVGLHDLRHGFAVRSLEQAIATDRTSVSRHILALSTYLGHVGVSSTQWYLHATPVLLRQVAETAEARHLGRSSS